VAQLKAPELMEPKGPVGKGKIETGGSETHGLVRIKSRCGVEEKGKSDLSNTTCRERGIIAVYSSTLEGWVAIHGPLYGLYTSHMGHSHIYTLTLLSSLHLDPSAFVYFFVNIAHLFV
jgi:hypothetical protein